ncbi:MAG: ferrochelatase, partial [Proteobacteria bacterium]|nr:ferrochelatase [Pseudomonadota bacterium]
KTAVVLLNMGGPGSLDDVEPFLYNLFMDPDIISIPLGRLLRPFIARKISRKRAEKVRGYYKKIGGKSPLLDLSIDQARSLEEALKTEGDYSVSLAMRYWHPFTEEAISQLIQDAPDRIILLPLYPQFSTATSGSSLNEFSRLWQKKDTELIKIVSWHDHPRYIKSWAEAINDELDGLKDRHVSILFSAHGIPQSMIDKGDPYQSQTEETVRLILEELQWNGKWQLCYQSRVGPVKWLEPSTESVIQEWGSRQKDIMLMVPISFVSDHSETLYEMDIQYKELALEAGIRDFRRVASLNSRPLFIESLKEIVLQAAIKGQDI